jgi:hypothetical protein
MCSPLDIRNQVSHPHKMTGTISILKIRTWNILKKMEVHIAWTHCSYKTPPPPTQNTRTKECHGEVTEPKLPRVLAVNWE